jgi:hypothetical protein
MQVKDSLKHNRLTSQYVHCQIQQFLFKTVLMTLQLPVPAPKIILFSKRQCPTGTKPSQVIEQTLKI